MLMLTSGPLLVWRQAKTKQKPAVAKGEEDVIFLDASFLARWNCLNSGWCVVCGMYWTWFSCLEKCLLCSRRVVVWHTRRPTWSFVVWIVGVWSPLSFHPGPRAPFLYPAQLIEVNEYVDCAYFVAGPLAVDCVLLSFCSLLEVFT